MNYALIGALLFLTSSYLISSLKGKDRKVKVKAILSYLGFFLLFGIFVRKSNNPKNHTLSSKF